MLEVNDRRSGTLRDEYVVVRSIGCSIQYLSCTRFSCESRNAESDDGTDRLRRIAVDLPAIRLA